MSIITKYEIIKYSPAKKYVSQDNLCQLADIVEPKALKDCFGKDFYKSMKACVNDWTNVPNYTPGTYALNALVLFDGCVIKSLEANNTEVPTYNSTKWGVADKFTEEKYNEFWKSGGAMLVACNVILKDCVFQSYKLEGNGLTKVAAIEGITTVTKEELSIYRITIEQLISDCFENLVDWVKENSTTGGGSYNFSECDFIKIECLPCSETQNNNDRIAYAG